MECRSDITLLLPGYGSHAAVTSLPIVVQLDAADVACGDVLEMPDIPRSRRTHRISFPLLACNYVYVQKLGHSVTHPRRGALLFGPHNARRFSGGVIARAVLWIDSNDSSLSDGLAVHAHYLYQRMPIIRNNSDGASNPTKVAMCKISVRNLYAPGEQAHSGTAGSSRMSVLWTHYSWGPIPSSCI